MLSKSLFECARRLQRLPRPPMHHVASAWRPPSASHIHTRGLRRFLCISSMLLSSHPRKAAQLRCPLLAQSGHRLLHRTCPLSEAKRTCPFAPRTCLLLTQADITRSRSKLHSSSFLALVALTPIVMPPDEQQSALERVSNFWITRLRR